MRLYEYDVVTYTHGKHINDITDEYKGNTSIRRHEKLYNLIFGYFFNISNVRANFRIISKIFSL